MEKTLPLISSSSAAGSGSARPVRFGVVAASARSGNEWISKARRAEALGYATLAMAAAATRSLRLGAYVLPNDIRNPVLLAKEVATLDLLSAGRFELGIGAGHPDSSTENRMLGVPFDSGAVRVARLAESLGILKALLAGQRPGTSGTHYSVADAEISPPSAPAPAHPGRGQRPATAPPRRARGGHHRHRSAARRFGISGSRARQLDP